MSVLSWLLLLLIPLMLLAFVRRGSVRRYYIITVASTFRRHKALSPETAKSFDDLGLSRRRPEGNPFIEMLFGGMFREDGKQEALESLIRKNIVVILPDGRVYLSESKLKSEGY